MLCNFHSKNLTKMYYITNCDYIYYMFGILVDLFIEKIFGLFIKKKKWIFYQYIFYFRRIFKLWETNYVNNFIKIFNYLLCESNSNVFPKFCYNFYIFNLEQEYFLLYSRVLHWKQRPLAFLLTKLDWFQNSVFCLE